MPNLLPCPFCGSMPEIEHIGNDFTKRRKVKIFCPSCRIERTNAAIHQNMTWLENISIEQWNRRSTPLAPDLAVCAECGEKLSSHHSAGGKLFCKHRQAAKAQPLARRKAQR